MHFSHTALEKHSKWWNGFIKLKPNTHHVKDVGSKHQVKSNNIMYLSMFSLIIRGISHIWNISGAQHFGGWYDTTEPVMKIPLISVKSEYLPVFSVAYNWISSLLHSVFKKILPLLFELIVTLLFRHYVRNEAALALRKTVWMGQHMAGKYNLSALEDSKPDVISHGIAIFNSVYDMGSSFRKCRRKL